MSFFNLFRSHFFNNFFLRNCSIRISTNSRQTIPHVSSNKIRSRAELAVIPSNSGVNLPE